MLKMLPLYVIMIFFTLEVFSQPMLTEALPKRYFEIELLENPRIYARQLLDHFAYAEIDSFQLSPHDSLVIVLHNGYAQADIANANNVAFDTTKYRVKHIDVVYTRYPYHKKDWLTHYDDLLSWRLKELFSLDSTLNNPDIGWGLLAQTSGKTAMAAKNLFHGIVLHLEPLMVDANVPPDDESPLKKPGVGIENGGFIMREDRNPDYFRSPINFEPEPGKVLKRNMDPKKLRCPTWN